LGAPKSKRSPSAGEKDSKPAPKSDRMSICSSISSGVAVGSGVGSGLASGSLPSPSP